MKVVILAGGLGTRMGSETAEIPKPMVKIGGKPIIWHIMKHYESFGFNEFIICAGYLEEVIREYFYTYWWKYGSNHLRIADVGVGGIYYDLSKLPHWDVTIVNTGANTTTGGRLKRIQELIEDEPCLVTYGDGVSDVNLQKLIDFHKRQKAAATLTAIHPPGKFGSLHIDDNDWIRLFSEKPVSPDWINGGYFVLEPEVFNYLEADGDYLENSPMEKLALESKLAAYRHTGFWKCMDSPKDKKELEEMWASGNAPWKVWQ